MRHTKSRSARRRKPHILLAVPTICRTPSDTRAKTRCNAHHSKYPTYSLHLFIPYAHTKVHMYTHTQHVRGAYTQRKRTHKHTYKLTLSHTQAHTHPHNTNNIIYTNTHIHNIYEYAHIHYSYRRACTLKIFYSPI